MSQLPCKDCASGSLHEGTPTGRVETLHGLPTYIAEPPSGEEPKGVVVIIPDAFGWELPNSRILADNYAQKGKFRVLLPEFHDGHWMAWDMLHSFDAITDKNGDVSIVTKITSALSLVTNFAPFMYFNRMGVCGPRIYSFFRALRSSTNLPIGCAGFCWGGKYVTLLCHGTEKSADGTRPLVDCGFTAHPSFLDVPGDLQAVTLPLSIANGTKDIQLTPPKVETVKEVFRGKPHCELVVYEGAGHGFAVRGDPNDEDEKRMGMEAEEHAIRWFTKHMTSGSKL